MNLENILAHVTLGRDRSTCVDISHLPGIPGMIRQVAITAGISVTIDFMPYDSEDGGPSFRGYYPDWSTLIQDLEAFLGQSLEHWTNYTQSGAYPEPLEPFSDTSFALLERHLEDDPQALPRHGDFQKLGQVYVVSDDD